MPQSIENAYLIILGQICLILSGMIFGIPLLFLSGSSVVNNVDGSDVFFLVFSVTVAVLLVFWIIIGWTSIKGATDRDRPYPNRLLVINILGIILLFAMNNIVMFSVGFSLTGDGILTNLQSTASRVTWHLASVSAVLIYVLSALYLYLCKLWNLTYYIAFNVGANMEYERRLWLIIAVNVVLALAVIIFSGAHWFLWVSFAIWVWSWIHINKEWLGANIVRMKPVSE